MYSYGPPHKAEQKQDDQLEHTYSSYVRIRDVALKTCRRRWTKGRSGERGSWISVLAARHNDDHDSGPESTWEQWGWRGTPHSPTLQHYWCLTIEFFSLISMILVEGGALCREAVGVFYSPRRLGQGRQLGLELSQGYSSEVISWLRFELAYYPIASTP